ncbi:hypothetical protein DC3_03750 [Deinococcus cellulosilyticus NBRC 106333 = KACC 11606]|uniref:Uncharacterized protein n=1 Tax=Deinococcus cellulosilyticus (strain DSM 18568 / NBRC 106333 / KACC 11606 / 5516J-15) TaxID=1223518 RepID=A0A511MW10_DEIC1|nr:hypothetical protein DC3_03750 [Deinococcus cellulosilyticus NBRC 106333 = KACC 11606]
MSYTWLDQSVQVVAKSTLTPQEHEAIFRGQLRLTFLGVETKLTAVQIQEGASLLNFLVSTHLLQD